MLFRSPGRPLRPVHPPPKREPPRPSAPHTPQRQEPLPLPSYNEAVRFPSSKAATKPGSSVHISGPVLTGSTHEESKALVQPSPGLEHRPVPRPPPPKLPTKAGKQEQVKITGNQSGGKSDRGISENKSKFGPIFKIPSFSKSDKKDMTSSPKVPPKVSTQEPETSGVKKRELTRNISSPVLISTTDRRSKHLVKVDSLAVNQPASTEELSSSTLVPPVPPHISLARSESDMARRNRPLPPRPVSVQVTDGGAVDTDREAAVARKPGANTSTSPRMPQRPPPPPGKTGGLENTRQTIEDTLAKLDDINLTIPDSPDPSAARKPAHPKTKDIKPTPSQRPSSKKTVSDMQKPKPTNTTTTKPVSSPKPSSKSKEETKPKWETDVHPKKPIFNPKARPGLKTASKPGNSDIHNTKPSDMKRKESTDSLDDDPSVGQASVAGMAKLFEGQNKPLLAAGKTPVARSFSAGNRKVPMTPPKPKHGVKQIRSVDV